MWHLGAGRCALGASLRFFCVPHDGATEAVPMLFRGVVKTADFDNGSGLCCAGASEGPLRGPASLHKNRNAKTTEARQPPTQREKIA